MNLLVYWDGDLTRELLDGNRISTANTEYDTRPSTVNKTDLLVAAGTSSVNGSKSTPIISADLLGDWREDVVLRLGDDKLRVFTTTIPTSHKIRTLMHDPQSGGLRERDLQPAPTSELLLDPAYPLPARRTDIDVSGRG